jgi:hypothetical protein
LKKLIKLFLVSLVLLSFNTAHAFWGDIGEEFVSIQVGESNRDVKLKDLWFGYRNGLWMAHVKSSESYRRAGIVSNRKDIKLVEKYLKKYPKKRLKYKNE